MAIAIEASAEEVDIAWDATGRFERSLAVALGKFVEVCGKVTAGLSVLWDFAASTPLDFNVLCYVGKDVVFPAKPVAVARASETLRANGKQEYCWMWSSKSGSAATVIARWPR